MIRTYSELMRMSSYEDRFNYLRLDSSIGDRTFGGNRYINQALYASRQWKNIRRDCIARDLGCDLAHKEHEIPDGCKIIVHHMNPITLEDILSGSPYVFDLEYLITTLYDTHERIHFGSEPYRESSVIIRQPNDTCPWK